VFMHVFSERDEVSTSSIKLK